MAEPLPLQPNISTKCPECGGTIPVYSGYMTWCNACGWNVQPQATSPDSGPFALLYQKLGRRLSDAMLRDLQSEADLHPLLTPTVLAAGAMALLVHAVTVSLVVGSLSLITMAWPNAFFILTGAGGLVLAWLLRPDLGEVPKAHYTREGLPRIFELLNRMAAVLGCPTVDVVVLDGRFNAAFGLQGIRQRRVLWLGLPLVALYKPQELLALLGNELRMA